MTFVITGELESMKGQNLLGHLGPSVDKHSSAILSSSRFVRGEGTTSPHPLSTCW